MLRKVVLAALAATTVGVAPAQAAVTVVHRADRVGQVVVDGPRVYVDGHPFGVPGESRVPGLPTGSLESFAAAGGGVAAVVTGADTRDATLRAGAAGGPLATVAECRAFAADDFPFPPARVAGTTAAWGDCSAKLPGKRIRVVEPGGTRTVELDAVPQDYVLAGRTLASVPVDGHTVRLLDLDSGGDRRVPVPGSGDTVALSAAQDGTVAVTRTRTGACGTLTTSVIRPGAATAQTVPGATCDPMPAVGGGRLIASRARGRTTADLVAFGLDGQAPVVLDRAAPLAGASTDGVRVAWRHPGCAADAAVAAPLDALADASSRPCPVQVRRVRLAGGALLVTVRCPRGCHGAQLDRPGPRSALRQVGLRRPGTRTLRLPLGAAARRALRRSARPRVRLQVNPGLTLDPLFRPRRVTVAVRR